jgi:hypothetical protein
MGSGYPSTMRVPRGDANGGGALPSGCILCPFFFLPLASLPLPLPLLPLVPRAAVMFSIVGISGRVCAMSSTILR